MDSIRHSKVRSRETCEIIWNKSSSKREKSAHCFSRPLCLTVCLSIRLLSPQSLNSDAKQQRFCASPHSKVATLTRRCIVHQTLRPRELLPNRESASIRSGMVLLLLRKVGVWVLCRVQVSSLSWRALKDCLGKFRRRKNGRRRRSSKRSVKIRVWSATNSMKMDEGNGEKQQAAPLDTGGSRLEHEMRLAGRQITFCRNNH